MSLMPSLCAALERAGGDRLVMRAGERPHVLAGDRRQDVASAVLSVNAIEALSEQILSMPGRETLTASGAVTEMVQSPSFSHPLTAKARREGDDFCIELIVSVPVDLTPAAPSDPEPAHTHDEAVAAESQVVAEPEAPVTTLPALEVASAAPPPVTEFESPVTEAVVPHPEPRVDVVVEPVAHQAPSRKADMTVVARVQEPVRQPLHTVDSPQDLLGWIAHAASLGATTLYLRAGSPPAARIDDRIQPIRPDVVEASVIEDSASAFTRGGEGVWQPRPDGEWVREDDETGYVSCRVFTDTQGTGLIVQLRPVASLRLLHKHIPRQVRTACEGNGLVVVAASNEADMEGLAAAVADWSGRERGGYLVSIQRRGRSHGDISGAFVSQRTAGGSDKDAAATIRRATQEGPDILLVTGLQAEQPLQAAVLAAAGGRLVIVGVVASTIVEAMRLLAGADPHVRRAMAASFRAAIGYRSLRRIGGGRTLIQDVVLSSTTVCGLLESGDFDGLVRAQLEGAAGMRSVDYSLARAVRRRQVSLREAAAEAVDPRGMVATVRALARGHSAARAARAAGHEEPRARETRGAGDRHEFGAHADLIGGRSSRS